MTKRHEKIPTNQYGMDSLSTDLKFRGTTDPKLLPPQPIIAPPVKEKPVDPNQLIARYRSDLYRIHEAAEAGATIVLEGVNIPDSTWTLHGGESTHEGKRDTCWKIRSMEGIEGLTLTELTPKAREILKAQIDGQKSDGKYFGMLKNRARR